MTYLSSLVFDGNVSIIKAKQTAGNVWGVPRQRGIEPISAEMTRAAIIAPVSRWAVSSGPPSCRHVAGCHDDTCPRVHTLVTWSHANHVSTHDIAACWPLHLSMLYPHTTVYIRALNEHLRTLPREGLYTHYSKQVLKHSEYRCEIGALICKDHNYNGWL